MTFGHGLCYSIGSAVPYEAVEGGTPNQRAVNILSHSWEEVRQNIVLPDHLRSFAEKRARLDNSKPIEYPETYLRCSVCYCHRDSTIADWLCGEPRLVKQGEYFRLNPFR